MAKVPRTRIAGVIADHTLQSGVSKRYVQEVAAYLLTERRVNELGSMLRDVQHDWATKGYVEVLASSAHPLSAAVRTDVTRRVKAVMPQAKQVIITEVHDPAVIGGVRLDFAGRQLDLSVEAKLNQFKQLTGAGKE